jgi:hypothetical protein
MEKRIDSPECLHVFDAVAVIEGSQTALVAQPALLP